MELEELTLWLPWLFFPSLYTLSQVYMVVLVEGWNCSNHEFALRLVLQISALSDHYFGNCSMLLFTFNFVKLFVCHFDWGQRKSIYYLIIPNFEAEWNFDLSKQVQTSTPHTYNYVEGTEILFQKKRILRLLKEHWSGLNDKNVRGPKTDPSPTPSSSHLLDRSYPRYHWSDNNFFVFIFVIWSKWKRST